MKECMQRRTGTKRRKRHYTCSGSRAARIRARVLDRIVHESECNIETYTDRIAAAVFRFQHNGSLQHSRTTNGRVIESDSFAIAAWRRTASSVRTTITRQRERAEAIAAARLTLQQRRMQRREEKVEPSDVRSVVRRKEKKRKESRLQMMSDM